MSVPHGSPDGTSEVVPFPRSVTRELPGKVGTSGPGTVTSGRENMTPRARTFSQAPQAVRSARGRGWDHGSPSAACARRTFHSDKCHAFRLTIDVDRFGNVSGTAAARAVDRIHLSPSIANEFCIKFGWPRQKVNSVTKTEQTLAGGAVCRVSQQFRRGLWWVAFGAGPRCIKRPKALKWRGDLLFTSLRSARRRGWPVRCLRPRRGR